MRNSTKLWSAPITLERAILSFWTGVGSRRINSQTTTAVGLHLVQRELDAAARCQTVVVRVTGPDQPGVTAGLMGVLTEAGADVSDIEQIVICGQLNLGLAVEVPGGRDLLKELLLFGWERGMTIDFDFVPEPAGESDLPGTVVTLLGPVLNPTEIGAAANAIADAGANIDRITRLSSFPVMSYELLVRNGDPQELRASLMLAASQHVNMDVAVQPEGIGRRAKRLIVLDVDSTIIQDEVIELLAAEAGTIDVVKKLTKEAMEGTIDFESSLRERVGHLKGIDQDDVARALGQMRYTPGTRTFVRTLKRLGYSVALVSGGFTVFTDRIAEDLKLDHCHANVLEFNDGKLTGELVGPVVDRERKAAYLREVADLTGVPLSQTVAVGDGANDLDMLSEAGLSIAFNAKPIVSEAADTAVSVPYLDAILFVLGIPRGHVEAADRSDNNGRADPTLA